MPCKLMEKQLATCKFYTSDLWVKSKLMIVVPTSIPVLPQWMKKIIDWNAKYLSKGPQYEADYSGVYITLIPNVAKFKAAPTYKEITASEALQILNDLKIDMTVPSEEPKVAKTPKYPSHGNLYEINKSFSEMVKYLKNNSYAQYIQTHKNQTIWPVKDSLVKPGKNDQSSPKEPGK